MLEYEKEKELRTYVDVISTGTYTDQISNSKDESNSKKY